MNPIPTGHMSLAWDLFCIEIPVLGIFHIIPADMWMLLKYGQKAPIQDGRSHIANATLTPDKREIAFQLKGREFYVEVRSIWDVIKNKRHQTTISELVPSRIV